MMRSLRLRLLITHLLPLLVTIPLLGVALIWLVQTQVIVPRLTQTLTGDAALLAEITRDDAQLWNSPIYAQSILARVSPRLPARVMLFDGNGGLLGSSDPRDLENLNRYLVGNQALNKALSGQPVSQVFNEASPFGEAIEVWEPVISRDKHVLGVVRVTYPYTTLLGEVSAARSLIIITLAASTILGTVLALALALSIEKPIRQVTRAAENLSAGTLPAKPLPIQGPAEMRQLSAAFNALITRLQDLESARKRLLANLVHELGRPLGAIRSAVQALQKGAVNEPALAGELLAGMDGELVRLQGLLGQLTQMYDQVLGPLELNREILDPAEWLAGLIVPWEQHAAEHQIRLLMRLPAHLRMASFDPQRLAQSVGNLLSNAFKFTPPGGTVSVTLRENADSWEVLVEDDGPGIPLDERERIFAPFYRGSQGRRFTEGMGLGLSIAREIARAHGGDMALTSLEPHGSLFSISLPFDNPARLE